MAESTKSVSERVVDFLNTISFQPSEKEKIETLAKVQELVIHTDQTLLDSFFEEVVVYQNDRNADVRKFVVGFIEEACKNDHAMLPRLVPNSLMLLQDQAMSVVKRVIQAAAQILKSTLMWLVSARTTSKEMEQTWGIVSSLKTKILSMIDHDNDGVRTQAIKFLESVVLVQTYVEIDSFQRSGDFSLDQVPLNLKITKPRKLEEEAKNILNTLIEFQGSLHISSVNLMTCMSSLAIIARARPQFLGKIIEALEILHANLPPTLTKSQVNSVRKNLKIQLLNLLKHTGAYDYHENILAILNDLNATNNEINKAMPSKEEIKKRVKRTKTLEEKPLVESPTKKARLDSNNASENSTEIKQSSDLTEKSTALDVTQRWIVDKLEIDAVSNLVMVSMLNLPDSLPSLFSATYRPVTLAGSPSQVQHVARLLASQLTAAGIGPGAEMLEKQKQAEKEKMETEMYDDDFPSKSGNIIPTLGQKQIDLSESCEKEKPLMPAALISRPSIQKMKFVKLSEVTKPLALKDNQNLQLILLRAVLKSNKKGLNGISHKNRLKILSKLTVSGSYEELVEMESFIFEDLVANLDMLQSWIYTLYSSSHGFDLYSRTFFGKDNNENEFSSYDNFVKHVVKKILDLTPNKERDDVLSRLLLECPNLTDEILDELKEAFNQGVDTVSNMCNLLKDLIFLRPILAYHCTCLLCSLSSHNSNEVRHVIEPVIRDLYANKKEREVIIEIAQTHMGYLIEHNPPVKMYESFLGRPDYSEEWTEEAVRACLYLSLAILPISQDLIHFLAQVYVKTVNEAKRTILRYLEMPISHMGMDSATLLSLVETCPKGSETLITRIIHILTEKAPPSEELVCRVKDLYNKRVSDVRFLIPVLTGLSKKEVIAVLPKLIKLNPQVVKEVFNRLWGVTLDKGTSPLSPVDLLVALHQINQEKCDMKFIIKATGLCFAERNIYTAEVLAIVLQQLIELTTLPTLFMRTVIQTLTHHPKLLSFIMNILQRLISKQIWKQKKAWEGFIKCCHRSMPQSFTVLLQLPHSQLAEALIEVPDMQIQLMKHINELTESQKSHIPSSLLEVIENPDLKLQKKKDPESSED